MQEDNLKI